jgi:hypothetical protein
VSERAEHVSVRTLSLVAVLLVLAVPSAHAQGSYELSWWTVDGGGITGASGGGFTLGGTVGQPDAGGPLAGGLFSVSGGFWPTATALILAPVPGDFYSVTPCRMVDTRNASGPLGGPALQSGAMRTFVVTGVCGVPSSAKALSVNLAVTQPIAAGYLSLLPGDQSVVPAISAINYAPGQTRANNAIARLAIDGSGGLKVFSASSVHFILDVNGYFE